MAVNALYKRKSTITHHKAQNKHIEEHKLKICFQNKKKLYDCNVSLLLSLPVDPTEPMQHILPQLNRCLNALVQLHVIHMLMM